MHDGQAEARARTAQTSVSVGPNAVVMDAPMMMTTAAEMSKTLSSFSFSTKGASSWFSATCSGEKYT